MEHAYLGRSGLKVSPLILGNWLTHGSSVDDDVARATVQAALDVGITTFDTADAYAGGRAEKLLGEALRSVNRDSVEILSKVYWPTGSKGPNDEGLSRKHVLTSIDHTLRRLDTDYVDVYQAHRYDTETPLEETMTAFADIVRQGKALYIGVSEWSAEQLREGAEFARDLKIQLVSNQPQYSLLWRVVEAEVMPTSRDLGISQIVWSPLAGGVLTGKYRAGEVYPEGSRAAQGAKNEWEKNRFLDPTVLTRVAQLTPIAAAAGVTVAQLSLGWVLRHANVTAAIIGASRPEQVVSNAAILEQHIASELLDEAETLLSSVAITDPGETVRQAPRTRPIHSSV